MRFHHKSILFILVGLVGFLMLFPDVSPATASKNSPDIWPLKTIDSAQKIWKIEFNLSIDPLTVTSGHIYIESNQGRLDAQLEVGDREKNIVYITPLSKYQPGLEYKINITNKVTDQKGNPLKTAVIVPFIYPDPNAKIQYITHNYNPFVTSFTVLAGPEVHKIKIGTSNEMHYKGENTFSLTLLDLKEGQTLTFRAYDENNRLMETKKHTI